MKTMSNVDVYTISYELNKLLTGARVDKSFQPTNDTVVMRFHKAGYGRIDLVMQAGVRLHISQYPLENPLTPPSFPMLLRKRVKGANVISIKQHEFDRVVEIKMQKEQNYTLIVELFDKGNIILLDEEKNIILPLKRKHVGNRDISSKKIYEFPAQHGMNPITINLLEFNDLIRYSDSDIVRTLARNGLGSLYAEEIISHTNIDKNTECSNLNNDDVEKLYDALTETFKPLKEDAFKPQIDKEEKEDKKKEYLVPLNLGKYQNMEKTEFKTFNEAADEFYSSKVNKEITNVQERAWNKKVGKFEKRLKLQEETLEGFHETIETCQHKGELIYSHYTEIESLQKVILNARDKEYSWKQINNTLKKAKKSGLKDSNIFESMDKLGTMTLVLEDTHINIDCKKSLNDNAEIYYEKSKKAKHKINGANIAIENTRKQLKDIRERKTVAMEKVNVTQKRVKKELKWFEKLRWFLSSDGFLVVGGRDANTNETIVKKYLDNNDIYLHCDIHGAPSISIRLKGEELTNQTIKEAGIFAASYSSAWSEGYSNQDVYYVSPNQVSKTPESGEYVPKGSFIIRRHRNYIRNANLELAVGIVDYEGKRIMAGPIEAVNKYCDNFVALKPGHIKKEAIAKKILSKIDKENILGIDDVVRVLPSGKCDIIDPREIQYRLMKK